MAASPERSVEALTSGDLEKLDWSELDALIADRVMDLEWRQWRPYYSPEGYFPRSFHGPTVGAREPTGFHVDVPHYCSDADASRELRQHMAKRGAYTLGWNGTDYFCEFRGGPTVHAKSEERAVAIASLLAVFTTPDSEKT